MSKWQYIKVITKMLEVLSLQDIKRVYCLAQRLWVKDAAEG